MLELYVIAALMALGSQVIDCLIVTARWNVDLERNVDQHVPLACQQSNHTCSFGRPATTSTPSIHAYNACEHYYLPAFGN
jgi:hypothetical protein